MDKHIWFSLITHPTFQEDVTTRIEPLSLLEYMYTVFSLEYMYTDIPRLRRNKPEPRS